MKAFTTAVQRLARAMPNLPLKLLQAGIETSVNDFVKRSVMAGFGMMLTVGMGLWMLFSAMHIFKVWMVIFLPFIWFAFASYFLKVPDVYILHKQREIDSEIIFAGRFLVIEMESGVSLYDAFKNVAKNYDRIGKYFTEITTNISLGTEVEKALTEAIMLTPSANFRKILWQILNAQQTGADISTSLKSVVHQITKEQVISITEYGRKLNPLAMFYMIIAVILPSIGITMAIVLSTFLGLSMSLTVLLILAAGLGFMQYMFLALIKSSRPAVEL